MDWTNRIYIVLYKFSGRFQVCLFIKEIEGRQRKEEEEKKEQEERGGKRG